jgi:hypothetical protein
LFPHREIERRFGTPARTVEGCEQGRKIVVAHRVLVTVMIAKAPEIVEAALADASETQGQGAVQFEGWKWQDTSCSHRNVTHLSGQSVRHLSRSYSGGACGRVMILFFGGLDCLRRARAIALAPR